MPISFAPAPALPLRREPSLDLLRGIAILLVLDFHFAPQSSLLFAPLRALGWQHFGWAGVDIFFVLSGFLVGGLLVREWTARGSIRAGRFLIRRGFKIWPQYYVFVLVMLIRHHDRWREYIGNLLNIQNYTSGRSGFDAPLPHTWSLAVEEHFYLILVAAIVFAIWRQASFRTVFWTLAAVATAVSLARFLWLYSGHQNDVYTHLRLDGLIWGVLLAMLYHRVPRRFHALQTRWWWLLPIAALVVFRFQSSLTARAAGVSLADWSGVALLLMIFRDRDPARPHLWPYRFVVWLGVNSYGIYLWHESVAGPSHTFAQILPTWLQGAAVAVTPWLFAIALGVATTWVIETPMLRLRDRLFPRTPTRPATSALE